MNIEHTETRTIQQAQAELDAGQTLEMEVPAQGKYLPATYHLLTKDDKYTCCVFYTHVSIEWRTLFSMPRWDEFVARLSPTLLRGIWTVM